MASSLPQTEHAALIDAWIARYKKATGTNRSKLEALNPVLEELESEGVQAFPVKGMDLLLRCYASLGHRSMADIDLLVKEEDLHRISGPLSRAGFSVLLTSKWVDVMVEASPGGAARLHLSA